MPKQKNRDHFLTLTIPQNGGIHVRFVPLPLLVGFKLILENCIFWTVLELSFHEQGQKTRMAPKTPEGALKSKSLRKQTSFRIQFYIGIHVSQVKIVILIFSPRPIVYVQFLNL